MGRAKNRDTEVFAQIPVKVLTSSAFKSLRSRYQMVLVALAATYRGRNNGDLKFTRQDALNFGITSETTRTRGLKLLAEHGLIEQTFRGGLSFGSGRKPTLWALTWRAIDHANGRKLDVVRLPPNSWKSWRVDFSPAPNAGAAPAPQGGVGPDTTRRSATPVSPAPNAGAPSENSRRGARASGCGGGL